MGQGHQKKEGARAEEAKGLEDRTEQRGVGFLAMEEAMEHLQAGMRGQKQRGKQVVSLNSI